MSLRSEDGMEKWVLACEVEDSSSTGPSCMHLVKVNSPQASIMHMNVHNMHIGLSQTAHVDVSKKGDNMSKSWRGDFAETDSQNAIDCCSMRSTSMLADPNLTC